MIELHTRWFSWIGGNQAMMHGVVAAHQLLLRSNSIGTNNLKQLLGDKYDELVDLRQVKLTVPAVAAP